MEELSADDVEEFLMKNPNRAKTMLSKLGLGERFGKLFEKPKAIEKTAALFIDAVENALFRKRYATVDQDKIHTANRLFKDTMQLINTDLQVATVCHKILQSLSILLPCERASLFLVRGKGSSRYLVSLLFDVSTHSTLNESLCRKENTIRIPFGKGILGYVAENKQTQNIRNVDADPRFLDGIDKKSGFRTKSILCMPILDKFNNLLGVAELLNKKNNEYFNEEDEHICETFLSFCSISITNYIFNQNSVVEYKRHKLLLKLNQCILEHQNVLPELMDSIMKIAIEMLQCGSISVFLIDQTKSCIQPTKTSKVYQLLKETTDITEETIEDDVKYAIEKNIASGNTFDVMTFPDPDSVDSVQLESRMKHWLTCFAVEDPKGTYVGWMVYDRESVDVFDENDINIMETFAKFCGLAIYNCQLYEHAQKSLAKLEFTDTVVERFIICQQETLDHFVCSEIESAAVYNIDTFEFNCSVISEYDTVWIVMRMFLDVKALSVLNINIELLYRWVLTVKKNYRPHLYHNWLHAVNTTQTMYFILTTGNLKIYFTEFEQICLLMASLCHDIDHRGINNAFQVKTLSAFARLYSTSPMERHHVFLCLRILKIEYTNIFKNIPAELYKQGIQLIEKAILFTDITVQFQNRGEFKKIIESEDISFESRRDRDLLISMMMTASDISALTKPWEIQRRIAVIVAAEFFEQGDLETSLKFTVLPTMDRSKRHDLPNMQVDFIDNFCTMIYKLLSEVSKSLKPLYDQLLINRKHWSNIAAGIEPFSFDKELELALSNISFSSVIAWNISQSVPGTLKNERKTLGDENVQTNISIPSEAFLNHFEFSLVRPLTNTVSCQTEPISEKQSIGIQTYKPSMRYTLPVPITMPHEQLVLNTGIEMPVKSLPRKTQSTDTGRFLPEKNLFDEKCLELIKNKRLSCQIALNSRGERQASESPKPAEIPPNPSPQPQSEETDSIVTNNSMRRMTSNSSGLGNNKVTPVSTTRDEKHINSNGRQNSNACRKKELDARHFSIHSARRRKLPTHYLNKRKLGQETFDIDEALFKVSGCQLNLDGRNGSLKYKL